MKQLSPFLEMRYILLKTLGGVTLAFLIVQTNGCMPSVDTRKNAEIARVNEYTEKWSDRLRELGLNQVTMTTAPSSNGSEIIIGGSVPDQNTYELLARVLSSKALNPAPANLVWKVRVEANNPTNGASPSGRE